MYCYFYLVKFSLITIYGSNVLSKPLLYKGNYGFNESRSFIYTQLYIPCFYSSRNPYFI